MRRSGRRIHEVAKPPMTLDEAGKALPELLAKENYDACANLSVQILKIQPHNLRRAVLPGTSCGAARRPR